MPENFDCCLKFLGNAQKLQLLLGQCWNFFVTKLNIRKISVAKSCDQRISITKLGNQNFNDWIFGALLKKVQLSNGQWFNLHHWFNDWSFLVVAQKHFSDCLNRLVCPSSMVLAYCMYVLGLDPKTCIHVNLLILYLVASLGLSHIYWLIWIFLWVLYPPVWLGLISTHFLKLHAGWIGVQIKWNMKTLTVMKIAVQVIQNFEFLKLLSNQQQIKPYLLTILKKCSIINTICKISKYTLHHQDTCLLISFLNILLCGRYEGPRLLSI